MVDTTDDKLQHKGQESVKADRTLDLMENQTLVTKASLNVLLPQTEK